MLKNGFRLRVPVHSLLLLGSLILLPAWARADDFSWGGDSSCSDPPIFSEIFTLPQANSNGGLCRGFGNHSGVNFDSLNFTTSFPNANPGDPFLCSPGPFLSCDFDVDGVIFHSGDTITGPHNTITVEFFGTNSDHPGIPVDPISIDPNTGLPHDNFFINLNNPGFCTFSPCPPPNDSNGTGDWLTNGVPDTFQGAANGVANAVPEPTSGVLLLTALGAVLTSIRIARKRSS